MTWGGVQSKKMVSLHFALAALSKAMLTSEV
eukprot:CAMPEP_0114004758 /NCGR_PEP_ID=MMETSP0372-20130328/2839_1 /TAXON_ID=340204 /ORGANISM="Lankesteria abbotti" /LENGTH=30 /assembly_acc=CAM_ASM_000359